MADTPTPSPSPQGGGGLQARRPSQLFRNISAKIASIPMILTAMVVFAGGTIWTVFYSFTNSRLLPRLKFRRLRAV
jgi:glucose/mannose transport system permease protein